jgi:hypothetical protein
MATIKLPIAPIVNFFEKCWENSFVRWGVTPFLVSNILLFTFSTWVNDIYAGILGISFIAVVLSLLYWFLEKEFPFRLMPLALAIFISFFLKIVIEPYYITSTSQIVFNVETKEVLHDGNSGGLTVFVDESVQFSKETFKGTGKIYIMILNSDVVSSVEDIPTVELKFDWAWNRDYVLQNYEWDFEKVVDDTLQTYFAENYETLNEISASAKACEVTVDAGYVDGNGNCVLGISNFSITLQN